MESMRPISAPGELAPLSLTKSSSASCGFPPSRKNWHKQQQSKNAGIGRASSNGMSQSAGSLLPSASQTCSSTFGRTKSTANVKLPPLPKQALTFDNLYMIAKKRAFQKNAEGRQLTLASPPTSPTRSLPRQSPSVLVVAPDPPEEKSWAAETLACVEPDEEDEFSTQMTPQTRQATKQARLASKHTSASEALASQISSPEVSRPESETPKVPMQRETRDEAAQKSNAYIQALRLIIESDSADFKCLSSSAAAVAQAGQQGAISMRIKDSVAGFTDVELKRMKIAFNRFKAAEDNEIHKDELEQALHFLGYMRIDLDVCKEIADELSSYSMLDWQEYIDFIEKFANYERDSFQKDFDSMDSDGSGQLNIEELKVLISNLGITPMSATLKEALEVVDFDGSGVLDFNEFVHLMSVYRVTEGFTRSEVQKLKALFDRVCVQAPNGAKEVKADRLQDAMSYIFGPQANQLALRLARRFARGDHTVPAADAAQGAIPESSPTDWETFDTPAPGLPFPEFLLWARRLREAEIEEYRKHYKIADVDQSGFIGPEEIRQVIQSIGYMPLATVVEEVVNTVDVNGDKQLDFDEFVNLMEVFRKTDGFCERERTELEEIFDKFKEDDEYGGFVNCLELLELMRAQGYVTNLDNVRRFLKQVDFDSSNTVDLPEFIRLMRMHREVELNQALEMFNVESECSGRDRIEMTQLQTMCKNIGYKASDEVMADVLAKLNAGHEEPLADFDFDVFVNAIDICRKELRESRRKQAGFSDDEIERYANAFAVYDEDSSGDIEKDELTKLLADLGIPLGTKKEQEDMLRKLDVARQMGLDVGLTHEELGAFGDPSVTFPTLLFVFRMIATEKDRGEVDRDNEISEKLRFNPKEVEEFREIFTYWVARASALDSGQDAPDAGNEFTEGLINATGISSTGEDGAKNLTLTADGMRRVVRSLGLAMTPQDKKELDEKIDDLQTDEDAPGRYNFMSFLYLMRGIMDCNFCNLNETMSMQAAAAAEQAARPDSSGSYQ